MDAALPSACDGDVDAGKTLHTRTTKDDEGCAMDTSPPPYNGDDDADKTARILTTRARVFLAVGLALEVCATLWSFQQAVSAGALQGYADCDMDSHVARLYNSPLVEDQCDGQIGIDVFYNYVDTLTDDLYIYTNTSYSSTSPYSGGYLTYLEERIAYWEEYDGCDSPIDASTAQDGFDKLCNCQSLYDTEWENRPCSWVALSNTSDGICYAQGVFTNNSDGAIMSVSDYYGTTYCTPKNPLGAMELTTTALVVALSSQLLEAFVGFKYWKDTENKTAPTLAGSVFEALGVLTVSSVLLSQPKFNTAFDGTSNLLAFNNLAALFWMAWTAVASAIVGALAEITAECSDRASGRLPYLGAVGNGLIWLGAALLEVVVTTFLVWVGDTFTTVAEFALEIGGLFAFELLGLVAMWIARGMWTRSKLLRSSVKRLDRPLRKRALNTHIIPIMAGLQGTTTD